MNKTKRTLLVVDDDKIFCSAVSEFLKRFNVEVFKANSGGEGVQVCSRRKIDIVLLDQKLPDGEGQAICQPILGFNDQTKIIFTTAFPSYKNAVAAIKAGAYDYLSKPFELDELQLAVEMALRTLDLENVEQVQHYKDDKESKTVVLIGGHGLAELKRHLELAAQADAPVLITGETGTGKNVAAKYIHYWGTARKGAFIPINCAAIPESLIEAELFGYEKGSFTGAVSSRKGIFEMAEGGTLLLDEIGAMPLHLQSKLLSVLEDKKIKRLGGVSIRDVDARIIATTNIDPESAVEENSFRRDLYYRLSVIRIHIPPLRERRHDIPELCGYFMEKLAMGRETVLPDSEMARLMEYDWPGNVRELQNIFERAFILRSGNILKPSELVSKREYRTDIGVSSPSPDKDEAEIPTLEEVERDHITAVLQRMAGNYSRTAKALGISRSTLKRKLPRCGLFETA